MLGVPEPPSCRVQAYLGVSWLWEFGPTSGGGFPFPVGIPAPKDSLTWR